MTAIQVFGVRALRRTELKWDQEQRNKWINRFRTLIVILTIFGIIYIWANIGITLLSVSAIALATVMTVKELLVCVDGAFLRFRANSFEIGDRIYINGIRGDVLEIGILTTKLLETVSHGGQSHSGRIVQFPNSWLVTNHVVNESLLENFSMYAISVPLPRKENWKLAKDILERVAKEECSPYLLEARALSRKIERERGLLLPSTDVHVTIGLPDYKHTELLVHVTTPENLRGHIEQKILERFLLEFTSKG